jgi:asparagine synthase (glutamine-hydrolysing)
MPKEDLFSPDFLKHIKTAKETYSTHLQINPLTFIAFKQVPWYHYNRFAVEQSQITQRSPFLDNDLLKLVYRAPSELINPAGILSKMVNKLRPELGRIRTDRGVGLNDSILTTIAMRGYYEFLFKMDYYFNHGMPQWLTAINNILSPMHIDRYFLGKHKYNHFRVWFRDQLAEHIKETLLDSRCLKRSYLVGKNIEAMLEGHINGNFNYTYEISLLLTAELMHRHFFEML